MLDSLTIKKIEDFVYSRPRSVQEIAKHIEKNWRTADRYIADMQKNFGTISTRTFREGTRGALKIVYWSSIEKVSHSVFQESLEKDIFAGRKKEDFSGFDIYQHLDKKNRKATVEECKTEEETNIEEFDDILKATRKQLLIFSGNLSFINLKSEEVNIFDTLNMLVKRGVSIKIVSRVDLAGKANIEKMLSLNYKFGKELVELRHREQPLRAIIFDNFLLRIKEIIIPTGKVKESNKQKFVFYNLKDKEWIEWISKIFWKMFNSSISAEKRLDSIRSLF